MNLSAPKITHTLNDSVEVSALTLIEGLAMFNRRFFSQLAAGAVALTLCGAQIPALAADEAPDVLIKRVSSEVLDTIKSDKAIAADINKIIALVDSKIMPTVNFQRMTASAVGPAWRQATPEQQKRLQEEFKTLLIRTYSGALAQVSDQTIALKPLRMAADDKEVTVRTEVRGKGDPIQLDYRLEKAADNSWHIFNLNVMGIWLVDTYRTQFAQEINAGGVDGLIAALATRNKTNAAKKA
jgi:phospholipid transport system substrate-binding protein